MFNGQRPSLDRFVTWTFLFAFFCFMALGSASAQSRQVQKKENARPNDSTAEATPAPNKADKAERARDKAEAGEKDNGVDQDDPKLRLEWEKKAWGEANAAFSRHVARETRIHNQRMGKKKHGADATLQLPGDSAPAGTSPSSPSGSAPAWIPIGPTSGDMDQNGSFTGLFVDSGRARAILPHPTDPNIVYFLTSGGGLWKTTNFMSSNTTWAPLTDNLPTTGGGSMAFGRDGDTIYLGLGDPYDQILVGGSMVKTTDGGNTWSPMIELGNTVSVRTVGVDTSGPNDIVMVGTEQGMFRSADSGATYSAVPTFAGMALWSITRTSAGWLASAQPCAAAGEQCGQVTTLYLSTDLGATWNPISNAGNIFNTNGRTTLAVANPGESVVYAYSSNQGDTALRDVYRSSDGGQTWIANSVGTQVPTNPITGSSTQTNMNICGGQCWYNQMILVDPTDPSRNTVYIGGNLATARTTNGGGSWTLTTWWLYHQVDLPYAHADFHAAAYKSTGTPALLFGSDGGMFMSTDNAATFTSDKNKGLQTHLLYSIVGQPSLPNFVLGGLQDNGTRVRVGNTNTYNQAAGGDGVGVAFSQANTNTAFTTTPNGGYRADLTGTPIDVFQNLVSATSGITTSEGGFFTDIFTPPASLDPTGKVFYTFTNTRVYKTVNGGLNWTVIGRVNVPAGNGLPAGRTFRSTAYDLGVSPLDQNRVAVGAAGGFLDITTNGGTNWTDLNLIALVPSPGIGYQGFISNVTWVDNQTIWVTAAAQALGSQRVLKGTIATPTSSWTTATWTPMQNGLPDLPVTKILFDPRDASHNTIYAATHVGIYRTTDGGNNWAPYGTGLPNVRVSDMYMPPDGGYLRIATYGRGFWELPELEYVGASITDDSTSCDHDGALDNGETGHLTITLHNQGPLPLSNITATITSSNPHVTFPSGNSVGFPTAGANSDTTTSIAVSLNGASGVEQSDFTISFTDPALTVASPLSVVYSTRVNYDEVANGTNTETFEASNPGWTTSGTASVFPDIQNWQRKSIATLQNVYNGPDNNGQISDIAGQGTDNSLISPTMHVGAGTFSISWQHRFSFENGSFDGGVVEISTDGGASWTDIGTPAYNGTIALGGLNPIEGRKAFVNRITGWPAFTTVTLNLGTTYANQDVKIRFRVGADLSTGAPGWDIDNITVTGVTSNPFTAVMANSGVCGTSVTLNTAPNPSTYGQNVALAANVSGGLSTPTGSVTFKDGASMLASSLLDGGGQALFNISTLSGGSHNLTAAYSGDATHAASTSAIVVQQVNPANQTITFNPIPNHATTDAPFTISASASSGLPVTFTILSGPASVSGNTITLTGAPGTVTVQASQGGNANFNAAPNVNQSFTVSAPFIQITASGVITNNGSGYTMTVTLTNNGNVGANNVSLTLARLINTANNQMPNGTPLPQSLGSIAPNGGSVTAVVSFPASLGAPGTNVLERFGGSYTGGTFTLGGSGVLPGQPAN